MKTINGHSVSYCWQGIDSWIVDGKYACFSLDDLARACGVIIDVLLEELMLF